MVLIEAPIHKCFSEPQNYNPAIVIIVIIVMALLGETRRSTSETVGKALGGEALLEKLRRFRPVAWLPMPNNSPPDPKDPY